MKRIMMLAACILGLAGFSPEASAQDYTLCKSLDPAHVSVDQRTSVSNFAASEAYRFCRKYVEIEAGLADRTPVRTPDETDLDRLENVVSLYPWYLNRILRSYLEMYETTGDIRFLEKMISDIDVLEADASIPGTYTDGGYGWPTKDIQVVPPLTPAQKEANETNCNSDHACVLVGKKPYVDDNRDGIPDYTRKVVHSGNILYPVARFVELLKEKPGLDAQLRPEFQGRTDKYLQLIINVINTHNAEFCGAGQKDCGSSGSVSNNVDPASDVAFYFWDSEAGGIKSTNKGWNVPTNQQAVMGSVLAILWGLDDRDADNPKGSGTNDYRAMTKGIARAFWRDIDYISNADGHGEHALWHYWWGESLNRSDKIEDISHAGVDIEFLVEMRRQGFNARHSLKPFPWGNTPDLQIGSLTIAPNDDILRAFANTFTESVYLGGANLLGFRVDGSIGQSKDKDGNPIDVYGDLRSAFNFLDLAEWDNDIYSFPTAPDATPEAFLVANNAALPNKVYSIVKCIYDESAADIPEDRILLHGIARLTKWAAKLRDNDNADDRRIRCEATENPDSFYSSYLQSYADKLSGR